MPVNSTKFCLKQNVKHEDGCHRVSGTLSLGWAEITTLMGSDPVLLFSIHIKCSRKYVVKANQCGVCFFCLVNKKPLLRRSKYVFKGLSISFANPHLGFQISDLVVRGVEYIVAVAVFGHVQFETLVYGKPACYSMLAVLLGLVIIGR